MRKFLALIVSVSLVFSLSSTAFSKLPDGGPQLEGEDNVEVIDFNNFKKIFNLKMIPSYEHRKNGAYSGRIILTGASITQKNIPRDLNEYATLEMDVYSEKAFGSEFIILFSSPSTSAGSNYYKQKVALDWTGWKHFSIEVGSSSPLESNRSPSWSNIESIKIAGPPSFGLKDNPEANIYIGEMFLTPRLSGANKIFSKEVQNLYAKYSSQFSSVFAGSEYAMKAGKRTLMKNKAKMIDGVVYAPEEFFDLANCPVDELLEKTVDGVKYYPVVDCAEKAGIKSFARYKFAAAGNDVSYFKDEEFYRLAATTNSNSSMEEISYTDEDFEIMYQNWMDSIMGPSEIFDNKEEPRFVKYLESIEDNAISAMESMGENLWGESSTFGSTAEQYYQRVLTMCKGWYTPNTSTYHSPQLLKKIIQALDYIYDNYYGKEIVEEIEFIPHCNFKGENWYPWQVSAPQNLVKCLGLLRDGLTQEQIDKYLSPVNVMNKEVFSSAANRVWISYNIMSSGILQKDAKRILDARAGVMAELPYNEDGVFNNQGSVYDGVFADGSVMIHIGVPYTFGYGISLASDVIRVYNVYMGSAFEILDPDSENIYRWLTENYDPWIYKGQAMTMLGGRYSAGRLSEVDTAATHLNNMLAYASVTDNKAEREDLLKRVKAMSENAWVNEKNTGTGDYYLSKVKVENLQKYKELMADESIVPNSENNFSKFAYNMERGVTQRENYAFGLALSSKRVKKYEAINGENQAGWYSGIGTTYFYTDGLEDYSSNTFYVGADMYKMPGTTVDNGERAKENFTTTSLTAFGSNDFSGASVLENKDMTAGFQFIDYQYSGSSQVEHESDLEAKKAYFSFDDEVVMLGTDINQTTEGREVYTVVDQRKMTGSVSLTGDDAFIPVTSVTASENDGNVESNVLDGDVTTRWSASGEQWLLLDLGEPRNVAVASILFHSGNKRKAKFQLLVSSDGKTFEEVFSGESDGNTTQKEMFDINRNNVRYIKYVGHGNSINLWNSICEFEIYALDANGKFDFDEVKNNTKYGVENVYADGQLLNGISYKNNYSKMKTANYADKMGYYFPYGEDTTISKNNERNSFMVMQINHGQKPTNEGYAYVVLPGRTNDETVAYAANPDIEILSNTETVQAAREKNSGVTGYVFWTGATMGVLSSDKPAVVTMRETSTEVVLSVAEPTRLSKELNLTLSIPGISLVSADDGIEAVTTQEGASIKLTLPETDNGKSYEVRFDK